jgi:excisionase family DNA binding protein
MTNEGRPTMDTPNALPAQLLTIDQLAFQLGTSVRHVRRLVAERRVPHVKVGRWVRASTRP